MQLRVGETARKPSWLYFGVGAQDGSTVDNVRNSFSSASFEINFEGQTDTQVYTMFAHARKGEVNYSNNPTYLKFGQSKFQTTEYEHI